MAPKREASDSEEEGSSASPKKQHHGPSTPTPSPPAKKKKSKPSMRSPISRNINPADRPAECGIIRRIYCEEFMCHQKLRVDLCQNVNFIYGQNGSGKSAILAALQICLGAGAKRTHRARNLKDLVRKEDGATHAVVRVTLLNKGPDAFQHDVYGDTITIERTIALGSGGGYKLLDCNNKEKSKKKEDLTELLDQLNIQVENPVAVLDQEEAKKFLTGKPEDKYTFFTKATDLERMDRKYAETVDSINEIIESVDKMGASIEPLERNVEQLKKEYEDFQKLDILELKKSEAHINYAWSFYAKCLAELEQEEATLREREAKVAKQKRSLAKEDGAEDDDAQQKIHEDTLAELADEANAARENIATLQEELRVANGPKKAQEHQIKRKKNEVKQSKNVLAFSMKELQAKRNEIMQKQGSANDEEGQRQAAAKKAEEAMEEARRVVDESKGPIEDSLKRYDEGKSQEIAVQGAVNAVKAQCSAVHRQIQELKSSQGNSLAIFGQTCETMHRAVEQARQAGKFKGKVIGPIGKYMTVVPGKEHLAAVAEKALQVSLDRYIVTNSHDRQVYLQLRDQIRCGFNDSGVYQMTESARYNIIQPPEGVDVVASVLTSSNDLVFNCIVDNGKSDQKAISESFDVSEQQLLLESNGRSSIRGGNVKTAFFLPDGDYWQIFNGSQSITSQGGVKRATIGVDRTHAIKAAENEHEQLKKEADQKSRQLTDIKMERHEHKVRWNDLRKKEKLARDQINRLTDEIERIREDAEAAENVSFDTSELEDEVNKAQSEYEKMKGEEEDLVKVVNDLIPGIQAIQAQIDEVANRNIKVADDLEEVEKKLNKVLQDKGERARKIENKKKKMAEAEQARATQELETKGKEKKMLHTLRKARIMTLRSQKSEENRKLKKEDQVELVDEADCAEEELNDIEPTIVEKEPEHFEKKIIVLQGRIEAERKKRQMKETDPEVALEKYVRAKELLDSKMFQIEKIEENKEGLMEDVRQRKKLWKRFRDHIVVSANATFDEVLNRKGSSGEITFDHKAKTLNLMVQKDNKNEHSQTADVKSLSGGERSYTTLALLLALGESLETPFRVMDEFDVFLDPIARKIALTTMIEVAQSFEHRQFIFITPQDLSNIKTSPTLVIRQMIPPQRRAIVGGAVQQTFPTA